MADDDWVSDTESVEQDEYNTNNFDVTPDWGSPEPAVKGETPQYSPVKAPPSINTSNSAPMVTANSLEKEHQQEQLERKQAKAVSQVVRPGAGPHRRKPSAVGADKFIGKYPAEVVEYFTMMNNKSITEQAIEYLNAYWDEVGDQAEFIFQVAHKVFREADMHRQGITLYYMYEEGSDVDYPTYLYFYEKLVKFVSKNPQWRTGEFEKSAVYEVKTAIKHKNELKEKVDVNFDGRISFLEYLLYQYNTFSNPLNFMERSKMAGEEHPAVLAAKLALQKVNQRIKEYERERARLEEGAKKPGVKGLTFKHQLKMLDGSPLGEELNQALITAEAAVRLAVRKFSGSVGTSPAGGDTPNGALWWMQRDLEEKKKFRRN